MTEKKDIRILVLDDEENILRSIKRVFLREPFEIYTKTDPQEALALLKEKSIKVVISDQRMPKMSGVEFLKTVKEQNPDTIRILFTGYSDVQAVEDAINVGEVFRFINKPWNNDEFKGIISQAIETYDQIKKHDREFNRFKEDAQELNEKNHELEVVAQLQKKFTSTVSHELRTPLAAMKGSIELLLSGDPGPLTKDQYSFLQKTYENIERLNRLVNDILDLEKIESGHMQIDLKKCEIQRLAKDVIHMHTSRIKEKNLKCQIVTEKDVPQIECDPDRITQVLINLIDNAIKFTGAQGEITVYCYKSKTHPAVEVCVQDSGPGIAEDHFQRLFDKYEQLENVVENKTGGTGLGLAICKEIIDQHKGDIWVDSKVGKGTMFFFRLPLELAKEVSHG